MNDIQKKFILNSFFYSQDLAGCINIGTKLIENGSCIVAGEKCPWSGGIGNFIKTKYTSDDFVGCVELIFDLEYFKSSQYFMQEYDRELKKLTRKFDEISKDLEEFKL